MQPKFLDVELPVLWFYDEIQVNKMETHSVSGMVVSRSKPTFKSNGLKKESLFFLPLLTNYQRRNDSQCYGLSHSQPFKLKDSQFGNQDKRLVSTNFF